MLIFQLKRLHLCERETTSTRLASKGTDGVSKIGVAQKDTFFCMSQFFPCFRFRFGPPTSGPLKLRLRLELQETHIFSIRVRAQLILAPILKAGLPTSLKLSRMQLPSRNLMFMMLKLLLPILSSIKRMHILMNNRVIIGKVCGIASFATQWWYCLRSF